MEHHSAQQVFDVVRERIPFVTQATNNMLNALVRYGYTQALPFSCIVRYESNLAPQINVVCLQCGTIVDLVEPAESFRRLQTEITSSSGFTITSLRIELYGLCLFCVERAGESGPREPPVCLR